MRIKGSGHGRPALVLAVFCLLHSCNKEAEFTGTSADKINPQVVSDQEFPAAAISDASALYRPTFGLVDESLTMLEKPAVRLDLKQIERAVGVDSFKQGHDGNLANEEFDISKAGKLDLLIVVDDSQSMEDEQANLATKLTALTKFLKNIDWQVAVVTTSSCALRNNGRPIKSSDATAETDFVAAVNVGINGNGSERGILRAHQVFNGTGTCDNKWMRADASLAMLFVSDEESYCGTFDCPNGSRPEQLETLLKVEMKRDPALLKAYSLVWDSSDANCKNVNGESNGTRYVDIASRLNGISSSICDADFTLTLERISRDVSRIVKREFDLKFQPAPADLVLTIDGTPFTDYQMEGKKIKLISVNPAALKLKASYRYDAKPKFDKVALTGALDPDSVQVYVNTAELDPAKYQFIALNNEIQFVEMPADSADVKVKYRDNSSLPLVFDLAGKTKEDNLVKIEINGIETSEYQYDGVTDVLTFDAAPADGSLISVVTKSLNPQIVNYKVANVVDVAKILGVTAADAASGEVIGVVLKGDELVFQKDQVVENRQVTITFDYGDKDLVLQHELAQDPLEGTVEVEVVSGDAGCISSVVLEGRVLKYQCSGDELEEVRVSYKYVAEYFTEFKIDFPLDQATFVTVWIDGVRTTEFAMNGNAVLLSRDLLHVDSKVRIIVTK